jgi:hypothetical protein
VNLYATHQRFLLRAALRTNGPILELGAGWYSTPLLHEIAVFQCRYLLTQDNDPTWFKSIASEFKGRYYHDVECPVDRKSWNRVNRWGMVFVDHGPRPEEPLNDKGLLNALDRAQAVLDLVDRADVFVLHDTQTKVRWEYDWDKVLPLFKYRLDDTVHEAHTSIISNTIDVSQWN